MGKSSRKEILREKGKERISLLENQVNELRRTPEWIAKQLLTIGSSAAGITAGESPYPDQTPARLFDSMAAARDGRFSEKIVNDDMRRGILTEPLHRWLLQQELSAEHGVPVIVHDHDQEEFIYNSTMPWAHALPDGWIYEISENEKWANHIPVQLKCPRVKSWHEIRLKGIHGYWLLGSQHTLAVTGAPYEYFSVLNVETMRTIHFKVPRDEVLIAELMRMERKFFDAFAAGIRPMELLSEKIEMPPTTGELVTIKGEDAANAAAAFMAAREFRREAEELEVEASSRIKALMGEATVADVPGLRCYNRMQEGRTSIDKDRLKRDGIDLAKYEKQGNPFKTFRAYTRSD